MGNHNNSELRQPLTNLALKPNTRLMSGTAVTIFSVLSILAPFQVMLATTFKEKAIDQSKIIAIAAPINKGQSHQLLILEQTSNKKDCWREQGQNPTIVEPLLTKFDFTGICGRSLDANGYSIRISGQDLGLRYNLRIRHRNGNLVLIGAPNNSQDPELILGSANGNTTGFAKIVLNSEWNFTKRVFKDQTLGHVYLSTNALTSASLSQQTPKTNNAYASSRALTTTPGTKRSSSPSRHRNSGSNGRSPAPQFREPVGAVRRIKTAPRYPYSLRPTRRRISRSAYLPYGDPTRGNSNISSLFGIRPNPFGGGKTFHKGMDLVGAYGIPIVSTGSGKVVKSKKEGAFGNHIVITHGNKFETLYAHLSRRTVRKNQWVSKGQIIGYLGNSGRTTGPHLHYEIHYKGEAINPKPYIFSGSLATLPKIE